MKEFTDLIVTRVVSEPGDATRYDYLVFRDGPEEFVFAPCRNTFRYPQRLNYWEVKEIETVEDCEALAKEHICNVHTVLECIRTIRIFKEGQR